MHIKRIAIGAAATGVLALTAFGSVANAATPSSDTAAPRCGTGDLSVSLGAPAQHPGAPGQVDVPMTYTNVSSHACGLYGVPGADLVGPDDPNGAVYHLPRIDDGAPVNEVTPGRTATATITVLTPAPGQPAWTPARVDTIPPGQTAPLSTAWPSDLPVLRQDAATHPGTYVNGILADPA